MAREFVGRWAGRIKEGAEGDHDRFVAALRTPDSAKLLSKYSLTEYAMFQRGPELEIIFKSEKPVIIAGFLRNKRMWPTFWDYEGVGESDEPSDKSLVFRWARE